MVQLTTWLLSLFLLTLGLSASGVLSAKLTLLNQCNYTVWPASTNGSLPTTGFVLRTGESSTVPVPAIWTGRFWGRTLCTTNSATGNFSCVTGDCGSGKVSCGGKGSATPATLVEFTLGGSGGRDFYDVSLVDGFNLPVVVAPVGGNCMSRGCPTDLNALCPTELKVTEKGQVVACEGPCERTGNYSSPKTCPQSAYSKIFKNACPQAYSYARDDENISFSCSGTDYNVIFCPAFNNASLDYNLSSRFFNVFKRRSSISFSRS